jgi:hypothetical protein
MDGLGRRGYDKAGTPMQHSHISESSTDIVSSVERRLYKKALKSMYEIVRLGAMRLDLSSASKKENATETIESSEETLNGTGYKCKGTFIEAPGGEGGVAKTRKKHWFSSYLFPTDNMF